MIFIWDCFGHLHCLVIALRLLYLTFFLLLFV
jgi:hypothetical protein